MEWRILSSALFLCIISDSTSEPGVFQGVYLHMNRRILIAVLAAFALIALLGLLWVPPMFRPTTAEATPTVVQPTATATAVPPASHDVRVTVRDAETGMPVSGAQVQIEDARMSTDESGVSVMSMSHGIAAAIQVQAGGYELWQGTVDTTQATDETLALDVALEPNTVRGQVVGAGLAPLPQAKVTFGGQLASADSEGRFELRRIVAGDTVRATHPGYLEGSADADGYPTVYLVLVPTSVSVRVADAMTGLDVPGVSVCAGQVCASTGTGGSAQVQQAILGTELTVQRQGYHDAQVAYAGEETLDVALQPAELYGFVRDAETGETITRTIVLVGDQIIPLDEQGMYHVPDLSTVDSLFVKAPGYERVSIPLGPGASTVEIDAMDPCRQADVWPCVDVSLPRSAVRGIYASYNILMWDKPRMLELIDLVDRSPILNAIVVDIKGDFGHIAFESDVPLIAEVDAMGTPRLPLEEFLSLCQERHIYTVARMVIFKDSPLIATRPELAVRHPNGEIFYDREGMAWADPMKEEVWEYNIAITKEAIRLGFDEVQYDYLRFPSDSTSLEVVRALVYKEPSTIESRTRAIAGFVTAAKAVVDRTHAFLSADLFGYALVIAPDHDMRIGQRLKDLAPHVDYVCPMIYPSTFEAGNLGLASPADSPYEVIKISMAMALERTTTPVRPWLQHYWNERQDLAEQRRAAEEANDVGWCYWNAGGTYDELFFVPPEGTGP